jgi:hypothetical protein
MAEVAPNADADAASSSWRVFHRNDSAFVVRQAGIFSGAKDVDKDQVWRMDMADDRVMEVEWLPSKQVGLYSTLNVRRGEAHRVRDGQEQNWPEQFRIDLRYDQVWGAPDQCDALSIRGSPVRTGGR